MGVIIQQYPGSHPELAAEFPVVLLKEDTTGPVATVETKTLDPSTIANAAVSTSVITNTTGFYNDRNSPTPIFSIKPTPDLKPNDQNEYSEYDDDEEDYYDVDDEVE